MRDADRLPSVSAADEFHRLVRERADVIEAIGLRGSADAWLLARRFLELGEPMLVLTLEEKRAEALAVNLASYLGAVNTAPSPTGAGTNRPVVLPFPALGGVPFDGTSPNPEIIIRRLAVLGTLLEDERPHVVVASLEAALGRLMPRPILESAVERIRPNEEIQPERLAETLGTWGYLHGGLVEDPGHFSFRGGILDIYSPMHPQPVRIDLFGDAVQSLRYFDTVTQRSGEAVEELVLRPVREVLLRPEDRKRGATAIREIGGRSGVAREKLFSALDQLDAGMAFPGIEDWLVHFHGGASTLFDYLSPQARVVLVDGHESRADLERLDAAIAEHHQTAKLDGQLVVDIPHLFLRPEEFQDLLSVTRRLYLSPMRVALPTPIEPSYVVACREIDRSLWTTEGVPGGTSTFEPIVRALGRWMGEGYTLVLTAHTTIQIDRLAHLLELREIPFTRHGSMPRLHNLYRGSGSLHLMLSEISRGFLLDAERLIVLAEDEVFGRKTRRQASTSAGALPTRLIESFTELNKGDRVIHLQHGMGQYRGLKRMAVAGIENDFLELEYRGGDKIFLPVFKMKSVQKYAAASEDHLPMLDQLGGKGWESRKKKAMEAIEQFARELLELYARRQDTAGFRHVRQDEEEEAFAAAFPWTETPDQKSAIESVLDDMEQARPMDRLICGDVGFGKTEVAMRAAFKAACSGRQTVVLVPTTVLALQHYHTFRKRFEGTPYRIDYLNRFRLPAEARGLLAGLKKGEIDIVIGTHRLLSRDVDFANLGLLIIDEEQRFGVSHKEKIKQLRAQVDVLTMSATPIPRTLNLSLAGLRDISTIQTPPADRFSVRTFLLPYNEHTVREAVVREVGRGGQVFLLHNKIQTIFAAAQRLEKLVPEARVAVAHAQMQQNHLEEVMLAFYRGDFNVLVCTTLIESGLDIPNANTILIEDAHQLGLSQIYQLRGRVGRSNRKAYCYLMIPEGMTLKRLPPDARKRLEAVQEAAGLGMSFQIAARDMEIRGAGDFIGKNQSGQMSAVGYELYMQMLEEKLRELRGQGRVETIDPEVQIGLTAFLPDTYVGEERERIRLYRRINDVPDEAALDHLAAELEDRFGPPPAAAANLLETARLRLKLRELRVISLLRQSGGWWIRIPEGSRIDSDRLLQLVMIKKGHLKPDGTAVIPIEKKTEDPIHGAYAFLDMCLAPAK